MSLVFVTQWIVNNDIVPMLLKERMHHAQYVSKLEEVLCFLDQEQSLSNNHLTLIWKAQEDKNENEAKIVFNLLSRLVLVLHFYFHLLY